MLTAESYPFKEGSQIYVGGGGEPPMGSPPARKILFPFIFCRGTYVFFESSDDLQFNALFKSGNVQNCILKNVLYF